MEESKHVELTERQQFWIHHLQQCATSSGTVREDTLLTLNFQSFGNVQFVAA